MKAGQRARSPASASREFQAPAGMSRDSAPTMDSDTVRVDGKTVVLPKIGRVAMVEELRFRGSIREVTINRTAGTWFACFCVEDGAASCHR